MGVTDSLYANRHRVGAAFVLCLGVLVYLNSLQAPFVFEDRQAVVNKTSIQTLRPLGHFLLGSRPLTQISYALNYWAGGLGVEGYHVVNIAIHILTGLLVFSLVRRLLRHTRLPSLTDPSAVALVCAALFLVHPVQTATVTYTASRSESLAALFYLLAILLFGAAVSATGNGRRWALFAGAWISAAASMAAKETGATVPLAILAYDVLLLRSERTSHRFARLAVHVPLWLPLPMVYWWLQRNPNVHLSAGFGYSGATPIAYLCTEFGVWLHYAHLILWPAQLCLDYDWPFAAPAFSQTVLSPLLLLAPATLLVLWLARFQRVALLLLLWAGIALAPTSTVIPLADAAVERRLYLPIAFIAPLLAVAVLSRTSVFESRFGGKTTRRSLMGIAALLVASLALATVARNRVWQNPVGLWKDTIRVAPHNARAYYDLGHVLKEKGRLAAAELAFTAAARRADARRADLASYALYNRARLQEDTGRLHAAIGSAQAAANAAPDSWPALLLLGSLEMKRGNLRAALPNVERAVRLAPRNAAAHYNLASLYYQLGNYHNAAHAIEECLRLRPDLRAARRLAEVIRRGRRSAEIEPAVPEATGQARQVPR